MTRWGLRGRRDTRGRGLAGAACAAAIRVAAYRLSEARRTRTSTAVRCGIAAAFSVFNGLTGSWLSLLGAAGPAAVAALVLWRPRRPERSPIRLGRT